MTAWMTSTWKSGKSLEIDTNDNGDVRFGFSIPNRAYGGIAVNKTEFIAAVEKELDATVILHSDLPEITIDRDWIEAGGQTYTANGNNRSDPAQLRARAMRDLAAATYLEKNPPVDPKQVGAVASLITKNLLGQGVGETRTQALARALVQQGVRVEVTE